MSSAHLVLDVHLVKLVDAADAVVRQHQRARLDAELARLALLLSRGGATSGWQRAPVRGRGTGDTPGGGSRGEKCQAGLGQEPRWNSADKKHQGLSLSWS